MSETIGQFDTHKLVKAMVEGGMKQQDAELIVDSLVTVVRDSDLATKRDLIRLENTMIKWTAAFGITIIATMLALSVLRPIV